MVSYQVTIPASGKVQITDASAGFMGWANPHTVPQTLTIQNNAARDVRLGGSNVSAALGIKLTPGGSETLTPAPELSDVWLFGTEGDVIDVLYIAKGPSCAK